MRIRSGAALIVEERERQMSVEGWSPAHDDTHIADELSEAAACYLNSKFHGHGSPVPLSWPWSKKWWKPSDDRIRNLTKAGALIAAEIDRLQRQGPKPCE